MKMINKYNEGKTEAEKQRPKETDIQTNKETENYQSTKRIIQ